MEKYDVLKRFKEKSERIFANGILDKINIYNNKKILVTTNFLNLNEFKIAIELLNKFKVSYKVFDLDSILERKVIALIPDYLEEYSFDNVKCIKVITNKKLKHKDYMGSIYNIGILEDMIGDIFVFDTYAYIFVLDKVLKYLEINFDKVGNTKVNIEEVDVLSISNLENNFNKVNITVASNRIDLILAKMFKLSRSEVNKKILKKELYINAKCSINNIYNLKPNDIVSFKKCGKFKYIDVINKTKKGSLVVEILKYM